MIDTNNRSLLSIFKIVLYILAITSFIAFAFCLCRANEQYSLLGFVPLATSISFFIFAVSFKQTDISVIMISMITLGLYFIRNTMSSYILVIDNYGTKFGGLDKKSISTACILMIYETIVTNSFIFYKSNHSILYGIKENSNSTKSNIRSEKAVVYFFVVSLSICIAIIALLKSSALRNSFYSIFLSDISGGFVDESDLSASGLVRILYTGGTYLINSLRLIVPVIIICYLSKRQNAISLIVCLIVACSQVLFMTDSNMFIILIVSVQMLTIYKLYSNHRKIIAIFIAVAFGIILSAMIVNRFMQKGSGYSNSTSMFFQSYFPGITEIAGGVRMVSGNEMSRLDLLWEDIYCNVPFRSTLFGYKGGGVTLASYFNSYCQTHFQILPSITESSYYLSSLLSPVSSCVAVNLSFNYVGKMKTTRNILLYTLYSLIAIVCAFAPITFDLRIVLHYFTSYFILMYFYSRMSTGISAFQFKEE